ncbi:hypothetical protein IL306_012548 [Fusarium sp. DS 682]|nr:hypothetical protein IL306_012548 [Fusarium sp. DS 682]
MAYFMDDVLTNSDAGDSDDSIDELTRQQADEARYALLRSMVSVGQESQTPRRGNGRVLPKAFKPPRSATPQSLFPVGIGRNATPNVTRYIRADDPKSFLIYTDGACLGNGQPNPRAGWSVVFRPQQPNTSARVAGRLENQGPFGDPHDQTSNRAELRAVIAALRFRHWTGEGFSTLVIATDSEYVTKGATEWIKAWLRKGWVTRNGAPVKNKDLWEALLGELERWDDEGLKIQFWRIPREWNTEADMAAKEAAGLDATERYAEIIGVLS